LFDVNAKPLFVMAAIVVGYVLFQSFFFLFKAWQRAKALGLDMNRLKRTVWATAVFTIAPAVSIILGMITLSKFLGLPLPWLRLSVLGALTYELPAASTAASVMGISLSETVTSPQVYSAIVWVMTVGILSGIVIITLFLKRMQSGILKLRQKDEKWGKIFMDSLFLGMISAFLGMIFSDIRIGITGWIPVLIMALSAVIMLICGYFIKQKKVKWLENYAMPISMLSAMALSIPVSFLMKGGV
jgi:hypothetical protein